MAEKPSISKAVAGHLSGGSLQAVSEVFIVDAMPDDLKLTSVIA